jgi:hypothetical protein
LRAQRLDEGAGQRGLAAAQIAADRQAVAGAHEQGKLARQAAVAASSGRSRMTLSEVMAHALCGMEGLAIA